jgi:hypothetical protein
MVKEWFVGEMRGRWGRGELEKSETFPYGNAISMISWSGKGAGQDVSCPYNNITQFDMGVLYSAAKYNDGVEVM